MPDIANISAAIVSILSQVLAVVANVSGVRLDIAAILTQVLLGSAVFPVVAQITHVGAAFAFILAEVASVLTNVTRVSSDVTTIRS